MDSAAGKVEEAVVPPPSPRVNGSLVAHPTRDELIYFGGEVFDGKATLFFNELYRYSIKRREWRHVRPPKSPPPRSSHQAVVVPADGGSLFIFGGEFSSANGLQARASPPRSPITHAPDRLSLCLTAAHVRSATRAVPPLPRLLVPRPHHVDVGAGWRQERAVRALGAPHGARGLEAGALRRLLRQPSRGARCARDGRAARALSSDE